MNGLLTRVCGEAHQISYFGSFSTEMDQRQRGPKINGVAGPLHVASRRNGPFQPPFQSRCSHVSSRAHISPDDPDRSEVDRQAQPRPSPASGGQRARPDHSGRLGGLFFGGGHKKAADSHFGGPTAVCSVCVGLPSSLFFQALVTNNRSRKTLLEIPPSLPGTRLKSARPIAKEGSAREITHHQDGQSETGEGRIEQKGPCQRELHLSLLTL